jgi:hypothetical protein
MTIIYQWTIQQLECKPQEDGLTDVVVTAHWNVSATDSTNTTSAYGTQSFTLQQGESFTPYADLTQDQVVGWVQANMGIDEVTKLQENLDKQIKDLSNPPIVKPPLPWSTPVL